MAETRTNNFQNGNNCPEIPDSSISVIRDFRNSVPDGNDSRIE